MREEIARREAKYVSKDPQSTRIYLDTLINTKQGKRLLDKAKKATAELFRRHMAGDKAATAELNKQGLL